LADQCTITVDRRLLPGESPAGELAVLTERLATVPSANVTLRPHNFSPAEVKADGVLATTLVAASHEMTGRAAAIVGAPYATDCSVLVHEGGMEAVVFGPGDPTECHCSDERVAIGEVRKGALVLTRAALTILG
jgi:acetylornithine deacetylase